MFVTREHCPEDGSALKKATSAIKLRFSHALNHYKINKSDLDFHQCLVINKKLNLAYQIFYFCRFRYLAESTGKCDFTDAQLNVILSTHIFR